MNILFLSPWYPLPADNGSKTRILYLLRYLAKRHSIILISFSFGTSAPADEDELHNICKEVYILKANPIELSAQGLVKTFLTLTPNAARAMPEMKQLVNSVYAAHRVDAVIVSTMTMLNYATNFSCPKIIETHNSLARWMFERFRSASSWIQWFRYWVSWRKALWAESRLYRKFDLVIACSNEDQHAINDVLNGTDTEVVIVPNGVDCTYNHFQLGKPTPNHLIFNGSLSYEPNFEAMYWFISEILPIIRQSSPDTTLTITGTTFGVNLSDLPDRTGIRFTGNLEDIRFEISLASVCVVPIQSGGGSRLKILEAMALGTPVVTTSKGVEGLDVLPGYHLLIADDASHFARQTLAIFTNSYLRKELASNARKLVTERYDWREVGDRFVSTIEEAIESSRLSNNDRIDFT